MKNKFDFYEVVKINDDFRAIENITELEGAIMAMAQDEDSEWFYTVRVLSKNYLFVESTIINEQYLQPTGKFMKREDFYDGSTAKVVVDDKGRGHLKELHLKDDKSDKTV